MLTPGTARFARGPCGCDLFSEPNQKIQILWLTKITEGLHCGVDEIVMRTARNAIISSTY